MTDPSPDPAGRHDPGPRADDTAPGVEVLEPDRSSAPAAQVRAALTRPGTRCLVLVLDGARVDWDDDAVLAVAATSTPVVAVLRGDLTGHAAAVALAADLRVATPATTVTVEPLVGATSLTLPRAVGDAAARLLLLDPRRLDATDAARTGLVHEVYEDARSSALALAARVAARPGLGAAVGRALGRPDVAVALTEEARLRAVVALHSPDGTG